jgi:hypothetical protein
MKLEKITGPKKKTGARPGRGGERPARADFWKVEKAEREKGFINLEIYRHRSSGSPVKIEKIFPRPGEFSERQLEGYILMKHGPGAFRLRHIPPGGGSFQVFDFMIDSPSQENSGGAIRSADPGAALGAVTGALEDLQKKYNALALQFSEAKSREMETAARVREIDARTDIMKREADLDLRERERELGSRSIIEQLQEAMGDKAHPLHDTVKTGAALVAALAQKLLTGGKT